MVCIAARPVPIYRPRQPRQSPLYKTFERYLPEFERTYDDQLQGEDGRMTYEVAPSGQRIPQADTTVDEMVPGDITTAKAFGLDTPHGYASGHYRYTCSGGARPGRLSGNPWQSD